MWQYSDYISKTTPKARLKQLRLHIKEVSDMISNPVSSSVGGHTWTRETLVAYWKELCVNEKSLAEITGENRGRRIYFRQGRDLS